jgi:hypothetical protein
VVAIALGAASIAGCATTIEPARPDTPLADRVTYRRLGRFASHGEFDAYLAELRSAQRRRQARRAYKYAATPSAAAAEAAAPSSPSPPPSASPVQSADKSASKKDESITNNQESGVDEGDIVKASGEYFVILRRGRLFSVRQSDGGRPALTPVGRCNAYPDGASRGTWYDEMLIHRDRVIVIGYSYNVSATEVGLFRLGRDGSIRHEATHFLRSNDYYSSRNYASRLVDGKLIFYMPYYLNYAATAGDGAPQLPAVASWEGKRVSDWSQVLSKLDVYRPVQRTLNPTLHTVVQCDLGWRRFDCSARAVLGPYSRTFYVSRDAVYIWVAPGYGDDGETDGDAQQASGDRARAHLYRMPILRGDVTVIRARGNPIDQFSFKESAQHLNVMLADAGGGDAMWAPERTGGGLALLRVPLRSFARTPAAADADAYTRLPSPKNGYSIQNRFVGDWLLWGAGTGWYGGGQSSARLYATNVRRPAAVKELELDHGVDRIEALGANAVAVGSGREGLVFSAVDLAEQPALRGRYLRRNATQGETRSHGFFFQPDERGAGGVLGLPVRLHGQPWRHLVEGSAEVVFLRVSDSLGFSGLGALGASRLGEVQDACVVSCVDWYGNARPIFYRGRIFALLGYELVEGGLGGQGIEERQRVEFSLSRTLPRQHATFGW